MNKYKIGSNQHRRKAKATVNGQIGAIVFFLIIFYYALVLVGNGIKATGNWVNKAFAAGVSKELITPVPSDGVINPTPSISITPSVLPTLTPEEEESKEDIEDYVKKIFGPDSKVAIAVSHHECNPANAKYPECVLHSGVEYSVGLFQINLYNKDQWIHAGRVPGKTMDEKIEWLKDPYNNTLYAYWVFKTSGWNPWTAYTSGNYLADL